ncbi:MAG: DUF192 domain-containing protein [Dehalococcoidia bacterium]
MTGVFRAFLVFVVMLVVGCFSEEPPPTLLPTVQVTVEGNGVSEPLTAEVAATVAQRTQGLMIRQELREDAGMLFLFNADQTGGFWMKDTYIPLSIAYIAADGRIVDIKDGRPLDTTVLTPTAPYRMVLEVKQGWFERHGLGVGSLVRVPAGLPAPE